MTAEEFACHCGHLTRQESEKLVSVNNMTSNSKNDYPKKVNQHAFLHHTHSKIKNKKSFKKNISEEKNRRGWDSNPRGETPMD